MVNGDVQTNESSAAVMTAPAMDPVKNLGAELSGEERKCENPLGDKTPTRSVLDDHFARLKKRMRNHVSGIF